MNNHLKTPLYHYIKSEIESKGLKNIGGLKELQLFSIHLRSILKDCCLNKFNSNIPFYKNMNEYLLQLTLPKDLIKLNFVVAYIEGIISCCTNKEI